MFSYKDAEDGMDFNIVVDYENSTPVKQSFMMMTLKGSEMKPSLIKTVIPKQNITVKKENIWQQTLPPVRVKIW